MSARILPRVCWAYKPDGSLCLRRARHRDERRGCFVCDEHRAENLRARPRGGHEPHNLDQLGATPRPATKSSAPPGPLGELHSPHTWTAGRAPVKPKP